MLEDFLLKVSLTAHYTLAEIEMQTTNVSRKQRLSQFSNF